MNPYLHPGEIREGIKLHIESEKEPHSELFSAFPANDLLTFSLSLSGRYGASACTLLLLSDDTGETSALPMDIDFLSQRGYTVFFAALDLAQLTAGIGNGLYYYRFSVSSAFGEILVTADENERPIVSDNPSGDFQLLVYEADFHTPDVYKGGIMYQIFVDRFCRAGNPPIREDAELCDDWYGGIPQYAAKKGDPLPNNQFFGGTLDGVREKLPYLRSLGVNILYLNPIFEARSNHKYDTGDYEKVDAMFGGDEALDRLLQTADEQGIRVILDGVFNHTGDDSRYFNKCGSYPCLGAYQSPGSPYYSWYHFNEYPDDYECWWGIPILPRVDSASADFQKYICGEQGILHRYMRKGADGWRLDVADELDATMLVAIRARIKKENEDSILYGEVWEDASNKVAYGERRRYLRGKMLDGVMNYPLKNAVLEAVTSGNAEILSRTMDRLYKHYPKACSDVSMNFLGTHDTERALTILAGAPLAGASQQTLAEKGYMTEAEKSAVLPKMILAYTLLSALPGIPCIYYGDEAGMDGYHDPFNRRPYPWGKECAELLHAYRRIGQIRRSLPILADGYYREIYADGGRFSFERFRDGERLLILCNLGDTPWNCSLDSPFEDVFSEAILYGSVTLPPTSVLLLRPAAADDIR